MNLERSRVRPPERDHRALTASAGLSDPRSSTVTHINMNTDSNRHTTRVLR